jgi:hypothetical protein
MLFCILLGIVLIYRFRIDLCLIGTFIYNNAYNYLNYYNGANEFIAFIPVSHRGALTYEY